MYDLLDIALMFHDLLLLNIKYEKHSRQHQPIACKQKNSLLQLIERKLSVNRKRRRDTAAQAGLSDRLRTDVGLPAREDPYVSLPNIFAFNKPPQDRT